MTTQHATPSLLFRAEGRLCAFPIEHVVETMRPLEITPMPEAPSYVLGVSIVRGVALPVVDASRLFGDRRVPPSRFVTVRVHDRMIVLAVEQVLGVRVLEAESTRCLPPLLGDVDASVIASVGSLDAELLLMLRSARLVPAEIWRALDARQVTS